MSNTTNPASKAKPQPTAYTPEVGSLAARVLALFVRMPEEDFTTGDLAMKFSTKSADVVEALRPAVMHDLLEYTQAEGDSFKTWHAGPAFADWVQTSAGAQPEAPAPAARGGVTKTKRTGRPRSLLPELDLKGVVDTVRKAAKPPERWDARTNTGSKYDRLFALLHEPGMCADVPLAYYATLAAAVTKRNSRTGAGRWVLRRTAVDAATLWREA